MASVTFFTCRIWLVVGVWWVLKGEAFSVRRILPVVGLVISFVFGFIVAPIPTLLFALSGALGLFFPQPLRSTYWIATLAKYGLSLLIQLVAVYYWNSQIIPINVDQHWYLNNINSICHQLQSGVFGVNYREIVGIHNRLYDIIGGWLTFLNGGDAVGVMKNFNIFVANGIVLFGYLITREIYPREYRLQRMVVLVLAMMPSINLYSMLVLRDVLLALCCSVFFFTLLKKKVIGTILVIGLTYYLRLQFAYIMIMIVLLDVFLERNPSLSRSRVIGLCLAAIAVSYAMTMIIPGIGYLRQFLRLETIWKFTLSFVPSLLSSDFLFLPSGHELSVRELLFFKALTPEVFFLPLFALSSLIKGLRGRESNAKLVRLMILVFVFVSVFAFGYHIEYGAVFTRFYLTTYPVLVVIAVGRWRRLSGGKVVT